MTVQITEEALSRAAKDARTAVVELVRNAIDADARVVVVDVAFRPDAQAALDGGADDVPSRVTVIDDGHGISPEIAEGPFGRWGDSWKRSARFSPEQRLLLGKNGEGRFSVYALGAAVSWESVHRGPRRDGPAEAATRIRLVGDASSRDSFGVEDGPGGDLPPGTTVVVDRLTDQARRWLARDDAAEALIPPLAQALRAYPVRVSFRGRDLDPASVIDHEQDVQVTAGEETATLTVVEWCRRLDRNKLLWCDESGMSYLEEDPGVAAPGVHFTAYLKWSGARAASMDLALREGFRPELAPLGDAARRVLREHMSRRQGDRGRAVLGRWREEGSLPYGDAPPRDEVEHAERDLFEVIAVAAAPTIDSIGTKKARRLTLRLLKEALASDPGRLREVLDAVLEMPEQDLEDLHGLLRETSMAGIVRLGRVVSDRLLAAQGVRSLLFEPGTYERVLERRHLHEVLASNTWLFGERYALFGSDEALRTVARRHVREHLGRNDLVDSVDDALGDQADLRLDLALARALPASTGTLHALVVEIKRPSLTVTSRHAEQLVEYATAVTRDPELAGADVRWDFLLAGRVLHPDLVRRLDPHDGATYTVLDGKHRLEARPWSQIMLDADHRLDWLRQRLGAQATREQGLGHLRRVHDNLLPED
jgi:hypothetical protein